MTNFQLTGLSIAFTTDFITSFWFLIPIILTCSEISKVLLLASFPIRLELALFNRINVICREDRLSREHVIMVVI